MRNRTPFQGLAVSILAGLVMLGALSGPTLVDPRHGAFGRLAGDSSSADAGRATGDSKVPPGSPDDWRGLLAPFLEESGFDDVQPLLGTGPLAGGSGLPSPPTTLGGLLSRLAGPDLERLPVPPVPAGDEPLLSALAAYAETLGVHPPATSTLRAQIATLDLAPSTERGLAQLVLAYSQAVEIQRSANQRLTSQERALLAGDPAAVSEWFQAHPGRTMADYEAHVLRLATEKTDLRLTLQAADLMGRTVEAVRGALTEPPASGRSPQSGTATVDVLAATAGSPPDGTAPEPASWTWVDEVLRHAAHGKAPQPPGEPVPLSTALEDLAAAYGLDLHSSQGFSPLLPPSLDSALGGIVEAMAQGVREGNGPDQAQRLVAATRTAEPTLRAWSALLELQAARSAPESHEVAAALLEQLPAPTRPSHLAASATGAMPVETPAATDFVLALGQEGLSDAEAAKAASSLPPQVQTALALILAGSQELDAVRDAVLGPLDVGQRAALESAEEVAALLEDSTWKPEEARRVEAWARAESALDVSALARLQRARASLVAAVEVATTLLGEIAPAVPLDSPLPGPPAPILGQDCPADSPFSRCEDDVWLELPAGRGILVTGDRSTRIDGRFAGGAPSVVIDLGGDDQYMIAAGATNAGVGVIPVNASGVVVVSPNQKPTAESVDNTLSGRSVSVVVDVAGNERYNSSQQWAQGAARGLGALGLLWDLGGDDDYFQNATAGALLNFGQGFGALGGLGMLVDASGNDNYTAPTALAQGVGFAGVYRHQYQAALAAPQYSFSDLGGTGLLLDLGPGLDRFLAHSGQGFADGYGTLGLLYDEAGLTRYFTDETDAAFQGGRGSTSDFASNWPGIGIPPPEQHPGGVGMLIDLGGPGDIYSNFALGENQTLVSFLEQPHERKDDALWFDANHGLGLGLDSSQADEDNDGHPNLVELLGGSNPRDASDTPTTLTPADVFRAINDALDTAANATSDRDGDRFGDELEEAVGSDPDNPKSTPIAGNQGVLFDLPVLCPTDAPKRCSPGALTCNPAAQTYCVSLFRLGGADRANYTRPAIVAVDLGGDDNYTGEVAGAGAFDLPNGTRRQSGSYNLDVGGHDDYWSPARSRTQGYAAAGASLLIDLQGRDLYEAAEFSQGSSEGSGIGLLVDLQDDDSYGAAAQSQGATTGSNGVGALIDAAGRDLYRFATQAFARGTGGTALLLDAGGRDEYNSSAIPVDVLGLSSINPRNVFESQGGVEMEEADGPATGAFVDHGEDLDRYVTLTTQGGYELVSPIKNDAGVRSNPVRGATPLSNPVFLPSNALFSDGAVTLTQDEDDDGSSGLVEILTGKDPRDRDDHPGTLFDGSIDGDDPALDVEPGGDVLAGPLSGQRLFLPGLVIGGRGDSTYDDYAAFLVDLGGDDHYLAPNVGGVSPLIGLHRTNITRSQGSTTVTAPHADVALVLDVGEGTDEYRPDAAACSLEIEIDNDAGVWDGAVFSGDFPEEQIPRGLAACPSLGGALGGVALLADDGGSNTFETHVNVDVRSIQPGGDVDVEAAAWGATQGAGLLGGAGILATWQSTNTFRTVVRTSAQEADDGPTPRAYARGLSQGAGWAGVGVLASFASGNDEYVVQTAALTPGSSSALAKAQARDLSQGAAVQGLGILLDDGGANRFLAPNGFSQGYASRRPIGADTLLPADRSTNLLATGILWAGTGDDAYTGSHRSQGSGADATDSVRINPSAPPLFHTNVTGILVDGGGNDVYLVRDGPASDAHCPGLTAACALSQGAGSDTGRGLLLDFAGDDTYDASSRSHTQGVALGGVGVLSDLGGHDLYRALGQSQAYATDLSPGPAAGQNVALLLDAGGRDAYTASSEAQGFARWLNPSRAVVAFFLDASGVDRYDYPGTKTALPGSAPNGPNNWAWRQSEMPPTVRGFGGGADNGTLDLVLQTLRSAAGAAPALPGSVEVEVSLDIDRTQIVPPDGIAAGRLFVFARVLTASGTEVERVDILLDGARLGLAQLHASEGTSGAFNVARYRFEWETRPGTDSAQAVRFPDGRHELVATVWARPPTGAAPDTLVGLPDLANIQSTPRLLRLDNVPLAAGQIQTPRVTSSQAPGISVFLEQAATLSLDAVRDLEFPPGFTPQAGRQPGGWLTINATHKKTGVRYTVHQGYAYEGRNEVLLDGQCQSEPALACPQGRYAVEAVLKDSRDHVATVTGLVLVVDDHAPRSRILTPGWANASLKEGFDNLVVDWEHTEDPAGLGNSAVAGVARTALFVLAPNNTVLSASLILGSSTSTNVQHVTNGQLLRMVTVAEDALGNSESTCEETESPTIGGLCYRAKIKDPKNVTEVRIDFTPPSIQDLVASAEYVRPGHPVSYRVNVTDAHSGLAPVQIRFGNGQAVVMPTATVSTHAYTQWHTINQAHPAHEELYTYTIVAQDAAGNERTLSRTGYMDLVNPRVRVVDTLYEDRFDRFTNGRPGIKALVRAYVDDLAPRRLTANLTQLPGGGEAPCLKGEEPSDLSLWVCEVSLPEAIADGDYGVPLAAEDQAGNVNKSAQATIRILGQPAHISHVQVVQARHDRFVVRWQTSLPATSQVLYGKTLALGRATGVQTNHSLLHEVEVDALTPSTNYFFKVASESQAGIRNESSAYSAQTLSAFMLGLPGFVEGQIVGNRMAFNVSIDLLSGNESVALSVKVQDKLERSSPLAVANLEHGEGEVTVAFNTTSFADGDYRLILEGTRIGDHHRHVSPPFRIDNTAPVILVIGPLSGSTTGDVNPKIRLGVLDPGAPESPALATLNLTVDGAPLSPLNASYDPPPADGAARVLSMRLPGALTDGPHRLRVRLTDAAGNVGEADWLFHVDAQPPRSIAPPKIVFLPGPEAARPGGQLRLEFNLTDAAGVSSVVVDLGPIKGPRTPLFSAAGGRWIATVDVPATAPTGRAGLAVTATDGLGNAGTIHTFDVPVDGRSPGWGAVDAQVRGFTQVEVRATNDEPTRLTLAVEGQPPAVDSGRFASTHRLTLSGLRPNRDYTIIVRAVDSAGNPASVARTLRMPTDVEPPTAPATFEAASPKEGVVELRWDAALDNAGLDHYSIERVRGDAVETLEPVAANATAYTDGSAPAGKLVLYRLRAVDVAGQPGPGVEARVQVMALPHLDQPSVEPRQATSAEPFHFQILYRHAGGVRPDAIHVQWAGQLYALSAADPGADCESGCAYVADVLLPPTSPLRPDETPLFTAKVGAHSAELRLDWSPLVTTDPSRGHVEVGSPKSAADTPGFLTPAALAAGALRLFLKRRKDHP